MHDYDVERTRSGGQQVLPVTRDLPVPGKTSASATLGDAMPMSSRRGGSVFGAGRVPWSAPERTEDADGLGPGRSNYVDAMGATKTPSAGAPTQAGVAVGPDTYAYTAFNSAFNRAVNAWSFISQKQVEAINSVYTEVKKPAKPDLVEEVLVSLALSALGGTVSIIGVAITRAIDKHVAAALTRHVIFDARAGDGGRWVRTFDDGTQHVISEEQAAAIKEMAPVAAKYLGEFTKGAFSDGIKALAGPRIRSLLQGGKTPIDAFFEGKKSAAIDSAKTACDMLETRRTSTLKTSSDPAIVAEALASASDDQHHRTEAIQKAESLKAWLQYQARSRLGTAETGRTTLSGDPEQVTNMQDKVPGQIGGIFPDGLLGVVTVDIYPGPSFEHRIIGGALPGLSRAMLKQLESKPLKDLGLPIVFRVVADNRAAGFNQRPWSAGRGPGAASETNQFNIRVDEAGRVYNDARWPWHRELLAKWVAAASVSPSEVQRGAESIAALSWVLTLNDLRVKADKE